MKRNSTYFSCYSGSLTYILNHYNIKISEKEILSTDNLLIINCYSINDGIYSDIEKIVKKFISDKKIRLRELNINSMYEFECSLQNYDKILIKVDCKYLNYSDMFKNAITHQRNHYIVASAVKDNNIKIFDSYIPETPAHIFEGFINLKKECFDSLKFEIVNVDNLNDKKDSNNIELIYNIVKNYESCLLDNVYSIFISNLYNILNKIINIEKNKMCLYEMSIAISISGTIVTRKVFYDLILNVHCITSSLKSNVLSIISKYNTLRLMLMKCYIQYTKYNLLLVIEKVKEIEILESSTYKQIKILLEN